MNAIEAAASETDLTVSKIYPHTKKPFHYFMAYFSIFVIIPFSYYALPFLVILKLILYPPLYSIFFIFRKSLIFDRIWGMKNHLCLFIHYYIYKVFYIYIIIWLGSLHSIDDYWYGIDISPYKNYDDYMNSYRDSRVRWRFKKKLREFNACTVNIKVIPDQNVFFKVLFSYRIFRLIWEANYRKNGKNPFIMCIFSMIKDYYLLLFLPVRMHLYEKDDHAVGLATYLRRGNTIIMCQHFIANEYYRTSMYYNHMNDCLIYAFKNKDIRYVSASVTTQQSKQTCGCYPINYLETDEFKFIPFSSLL